MLRTLRESLCTTVAVLTEAFHMLSPGSYGADRLREFIGQGGLAVWFMDGVGLRRAFELMEQYADHPMYLADASSSWPPSCPPGKSSPSIARILRPIAFGGAIAIMVWISSRKSLSPQAIVRFASGPMPA